MSPRITFFVSLVLSVGLVSGALLLNRSFERRKELKQAVSEASRDLERAEAMRKELERRQKLMIGVENFAKRASYLGLSPEKWEEYSVEIEEPVTFSRLAEILRQTTGDGDCYFVPLSLHLSTEKEGGDVFLTLKGNFLARKR